MTDKQLAVLLQSFHDQWADIFDNLSEELKQNDTIKCHTIKKKGKW